MVVVGIVEELVAADIVVEAAVVDIVVVVGPVDLVDSRLVAVAVVAAADIAPAVDIVDCSTKKKKNDNRNN